MGRRIIQRPRTPSVSMRVHPDFFNKLEEIRRGMERRQGTPFSQVKITKALSNMMNANIPVFKGGIRNGIKKLKQKRRRN